MSEVWRAELLDRWGRSSGRYLKVLGGRLSWERGRAVEGTGSLDVATADDINWLSSRVRITHRDAIGKTRQFGVWLPSISGRNLGSSAGVTSLELLDLSEVLNRPAGRYASITTDTPVTAQVEAFIRSIGEADVNITGSTMSLPTALTFQPQATWTEITSAALASVGHTPVRASLDGTLRSGPYTGPDRTPTAATYGGDGGSDLRMMSEYSEDTSLFSTPNVVYVISPATNERAAFMGVARNDSAASPLSTVHRGERVVLEQVEVATQALAQAHAEQRLNELSRVTRSVTWHHPVDDTQLGDYVHFKPLNSRLEITRRDVELGIGAVVTSTGQGA